MPAGQAESSPVDPSYRSRARAAAFRPALALVCPLSVELHAAAQPEDAMTRPNVAVDAMFHDLTADLRDIAVTVDRASAVVDPSMDLIEASHALHRALVLLIEWRISRGGR